MKKNLTAKILSFIFAITFLTFSFGGLIYADNPSVTFIVSDGSNLLFDGSVTLPAAGTVALPDSGGTPHAINAQSALAVLYLIDQSSEAFAISNLQYYDSFGSFYLKCITPQNASEDCDNWQYAVNSVAPDSGLDSVILSGGEVVEVYFGSPYQAPAGGGTVGYGPLIYDYVPPTPSVVTPTPIVVTPTPAVVTPAPDVATAIVSPAPAAQPAEVVPEVKKPDLAKTKIIQQTVAAKPKVKAVAAVNTLNTNTENILAASVVKSSTPAPTKTIVIGAAAFAGLVALIFI